MLYLRGQGGYFQKLSQGSETLDMASKGLGEMFEGDVADMCVKKILLMLIVGRRQCPACTEGERGPPHHRDQKFYSSCSKVKF